jgi:4-amino-4-deoxy-L-arabinose transferase-like glycosyltransferase
MYRFPSAVMALIAALTTLWIGRSMFGGNTGLLAACLLVVSPVVVTDCHMARADETLLAMTTMALALLWRLWSLHRASPESQAGLPIGTVIAFWLFVGLGILAKGPPTPFVVGTCAVGCAAARRDWRFLWRLRPITGLLVLASIALPWLALVVREVGWDTVLAAFNKEVLQRAQEGAEGHAAPPGYYLLTIMAFFFPGALVAALGFERMVRRAFVVRHQPNAQFFSRMRARFGSIRGRDAELFLFFWAVPTWLLFEAVVTKFPHYIMPMYPALALFVARLALGGMRALPKPLNLGDRVTFGAWMVVGLCLTLAGPALVLFLAARGWTASAGDSWPAFAPDSALRFAGASLATAVASVLILLGWRASLRGAFARALTFGVPAALLAEIATFGVWVPSLRWVFNTPRIVGIVAAHSGKTPNDADFPRIGGIGYQEDSLLWTTRNKLDRLGDRIEDSNRERVCAWITQSPSAYLVIPRADIEKLGEHARRLEPVGTIDGFNYSDGDPVAHAILRVKVQ